MYWLKCYVKNNENEVPKINAISIFAFRIFTEISFLFKFLFFMICKIKLNLRYFEA